MMEKGKVEVEQDKRRQRGKKSQVGLLSERDTEIQRETEK